MVTAVVVIPLPTLSFRGAGDLLALLPFIISLASEAPISSYIDSTN